MSDVTTTPRGDATRAAILDTAEHLFRTMGYQKTAVADIARELRMSPANVYRFFASKSAICEAICQRLLTGLSEQAWAVARSPGTAEHRLRALFVMMQARTMELFFADKRMHDMVAAALDEHWAIIKQHVHAIDTALRHIVIDGQEAGHFARLDPGATGKLLHNMILVFTHPQMIEECREPDDLPQMAADMAELALRALRQNPTTDGS